MAYEFKLPDVGEGIHEGEIVKLHVKEGDRIQEDDIFAEVQQQKLQEDVLFPGYVADDELAWWYRAARVFVYPSLLEGFGLPVLEAMACGTPVVTSSRSSLPEVAGTAGVLIDPYDVPRMATAIERVMTDEATRHGMRERGFQQAARFSWAKCAQATIAVYEQVANA